jgi:hypothetical protein
MFLGGLAPDAGPVEKTENVNAHSGLDPATVAATDAQPHHYTTHAPSQSHRAKSERYAAL